MLEEEGGGFLCGNVLDEVTIVQQPRGSYVLEVFHGYLSVGGVCVHIHMR